MEIIINDHRKIHSIQQEFSQLFPLLKLEFSAKPHTSKGASPKENFVTPSKTIGECRTIHRKGIVAVTPHMTVSDVEQIFRDTFGLSVEMFHKSGNNWTEITTKMLPLEKLNGAVTEMK